MDDKLATVALQQGTLEVIFKISLAKNHPPPESMHKLQYWTCKYINVEENMNKNWSSRGAMWTIRNRNEVNNTMLGISIPKHAKTLIPLVRTILKVKKADFNVH